MTLPTITSVTPEFGPFTGGTQVTIVGTGFTDTADTVVLFGTARASSVRVQSATELTAESPACPLGGIGVAISVQNQNGTSVITPDSPNFFSYVPTLSSLTDTQGRPITQAELEVGGPIVINGDGFGTKGQATGFSPGEVITGASVCWSSSALEAGSASGVLTFQPNSISPTQITTLVPPIPPGTWWIAVRVLTGYPASSGGVEWFPSNYLELEIPAPPPPAPAPVVESVTDAASNVISTVSAGNVYVTPSLAPGQAISINGTGFGDVAGTLEYALGGLPPGYVTVAGPQGFPSQGWADFALMTGSTITGWTDSSIHLTLGPGPFGPLNSESYELKVVTAFLLTASSSWSNSLSIWVEGPYLLPEIESVTNAQNQVIDSAVQGEYVIVCGKNFGPSEGNGAVQWLYVDPQTGQESLLAVSYSSSRTDGYDNIAWWTDSQICALTPLISIQQTSGTGPQTVWIRVIDSAGDPTAALLLPDSLAWEKDTYQFQLTPRATWLYVVNAGNDAVSVIDTSTMQSARGSPIGLGVIPMPASVSYGGAEIQAAAIPTGIAANSSGTKVYVTIQVWAPSQSAPDDSSTVTWGGDASLTPVNGCVVVVQADSTQANWNDSVTAFPVGVNPQGIAVLPPDDPGKPGDYRIYVANVGSLLETVSPGQGSISEIDSSKIQPNQQMDPAANQGAVSGLFTAGAPALDSGTAPQVQFPLALVASNDAKRLYILDGGTLYNTNTPADGLGYLLVLDVEKTSATFQEIVATVALPGEGFEVQDMTISPDGSMLYVATLQWGQAAEFHSAIAIDTAAIAPGLNQADGPAIHATLTLEVPEVTAKGSGGPSEPLCNPIALSAVGSDYVVITDNPSAFPIGSRVVVGEPDTGWLWGEVKALTQGGTTPTPITASIVLAAVGSTYTVSIGATPGHPSGFVVGSPVSIGDPRSSWLWGVVVGTATQTTSAGTYQNLQVQSRAQSATSGSIMVGAQMRNLGVVVESAQQSSTSGTIPVGVPVTTSASAPAGASVQGLGISSVGKPTYSGLYTTVAAQGIATDGRWLYVSDLYGPVWIIDTLAIQAPGDYGPPAWLGDLWRSVPNVQISYQGAFSTDVVAALNVGGEPNAVVTTSNGVYVAQGGLSASAHDTLANEVFEAGSDAIPAPANQVVELPAGGVVAAGYSDPPVNVVGDASALAAVAVGNAPIALAAVQPFSVAPPPAAPQSHALSRYPWWRLWWNRRPPVLALPVPPRVNELPHSFEPPEDGPPAGSIPDWPVSRGQLASILQQCLTPSASQAATPAGAVADDRGQAADQRAKKGPDGSVAAATLRAGGPTSRQGRCWTV